MSARRSADVRSCATRARVGVAAALSLGLAATVAWAHGGTSGDGDRCRFKVGPYHIHVTVYQPDGAQPGREHCQDVPATGRTIVVLDYVEPELRGLLTEVRIVRDGGRGEATVAHRPPGRHPTGSVAIEHTFDAPGTYVGQVTVTAAEPLTGRFRVTVGATDLTTYYLIASAVGAGIALYVYAERKRVATAAAAGSSNSVSV